MSNYPPGTWEGDPRAPWNAPDAPTCICDECDAEVDECEPDTPCDECEDGTMREYEPAEPCRCRGGACYC